MFVLFGRSLNISGACFYRNCVVHSIINPTSPLELSLLPDSTLKTLGKLAVHGFECYALRGWRQSKALRGWRQSKALRGWRQSKAQRGWRHYVTSHEGSGHD